MLYVIKSPQSSLFVKYGAVCLYVTNVTRLRFRDTPAFFRGDVLFRDVSLYLLGEACETWTLLDLSVTVIKSVLIQKGLDTLCQTFHIPDDVHLQLPSPNQTIHEMPTRKIGVYTRFFEYANFRLPLSTFLVNVLRYYRINLSQLSVIATAKVSHFEILCRVHGIEPTVGLFHCFYVNSKNKGWMSFSKCPDSDAVCYTKPLDSLKCWNDHFFWVDSFACPASFPWHTDKNVSRDPFLKSTEFRANDYAFLVAHPAPFRKFPEPFLCLIGMSRNYILDEDTYPTFLHDDGTEMDLLAFIHVADPTKVKVRERERAEEEARLLDSTVGHVVPLLPVAPARADSELEASVERLFDESGGADQGDSAGGGGQETEAEIVAGVRFVDEENVAAERPKRPQKKRQAATDASLATLPFVTSSVSATPEHKSGVPADSITGLNLRTIGASERFVISSDSSHHSSTNVPGSEGDSFIRSAVVPPVMTEAVITTHVASIPSAPAPEPGTKVVTPVHASMFHDSNSTGTNLYEVFILFWNIPNDSLLDNLDASREFIDHLAPPVLFAQIRDMYYEELFTEFSVGTARQACLSAEVRMRTEYCLSERRRLESECEKQAILLKSRDEEVENIKAQLLLKEAEAAEAIRLRTQVSAFEAGEKVHVDELNTLKQKNVALEDEKSSLNGKVAELQSLVSVKDRELKDVDVTVTSLKSQNDGLADQVRALETTCSGLHERLSGYENLTERLEEFQNAELKVMNERVEKLDADLAEMACHLEEKFYPHLLTTISDQRWLLTHGLKLVLIKCLNSPEYPTALGAAISRSIEKGMQDGITAGINHGRTGRRLADIVAYNPSVEEDFNSALQEIREVDFHLLSELKSHKDASIEDVMNLLRLEGPLADAPGMDSLQPDVEQLRIPIYSSEDQVVLGVTSLSFSLGISYSRVERIRANIAAERSALLDLSTTFASASSIPPIFVEDYEIIHADGQENFQGNVQGNAAISFVRSDRGGEYVAPFAELCAKHGIRHEFTAPYSPQQNGIAERKNRTLKEMVTAMLISSGMSQDMWGEAILTATYLLNKIPRKEKEETPYELWMGRKPSYQYLRVWGCLAKVAVPTPKAQKIGPKSVDCIFIGYAKKSTAYRFIVHESKNPDIQKNTIMESRNASFFENIFPCLSKETGSSSRLDDKVVQDKRQRDDNDLQDERQDQTEEEEVEPRRSKRARNEKSFGPDFVSFMVENEPTSYREAVTSSEGQQWREAIKSEIESILQNHTWELVDLPPGCKPLGYKWIFKKKMKADGTVDKYKARLVIQGFRQREGLDYFDTYSPVTRITSIRTIIAIAALRNLEIHQMDVKTAFLNGDLEEEIYMNQPEGFIAPGQEGKVCRLVKSLYGLKQAPKQWHQKFDHTMLESGFKINECDKCVYVKDTSAGYVILCLYVDDMLIVGSNDKIIRSTKDMLKSKFDMKDMGLADVILGIKIIRTQNGLVLSQAHYVDKILNTHNAGDSGQARTPIDTSCGVWLLPTFFLLGEFPSLDAILLSASAFLFSPLGTCLMENSLKVLARFLTSICSAIRRPAIKASYSASLLVALNLNLRAYVNSIPSGFIIIRPAPEPSMHDDPSMNNTYGSRSSSLSSIIVSRGSSFGRSTMKSTRICPLNDVLGL
ncbi:gypsy type transposase [Tanacetum coccineum]